MPREVAPRRGVLGRNVARIGAAAVLALLVVLVATRPRVRRPEPSRDLYPVRGIDLSHHQGDVDWTAVRAEGIAFAYIKASEGGDFVDSRFDANWSAAGRAGVARGAYHFFSFCRDPDAQAKHFLAVVPPDPDALPPAIDVEIDGNCTSHPPPPPAVCADVGRFAALVERAWGKPLLVYANDRVLGPGAACMGGRPVWVRATLDTPSPYDSRWAVWQFADDVRVAGVPELVDVDVFHGDEGAFRRFAGRP